MLRVPGVPVAIAALFTVMTIFSGFFFTLALHLQDGLGFSPLRAGLAFAPAAVTFALVSLNWRRLPPRWHGALIVGGFVLFAVGMAGLAWVLHSGGTGGAGLYLLGGLAGAGMAAAFSPLMTRVLLRVPVELAADATGVVVTVNQLGPARRRGHVRHPVPEPGRPPPGGTARPRHTRRVQPTCPRTPRRSPSSPWPPWPSWA